MQQKRYVIVFLLMLFTLVAPRQAMQFAGTMVSKVTMDERMGNPFIPVLKLELKTTGHYNPLTVLQFYFRVDCTRVSIQPCEEVADKVALCIPAIA